MPIYQLTKELVFPHPSLAEPDGVLAIGGDLCTERLILAYQNAIFPWYSEGEPIVWHAPDPRFVLFPNELHIPKSLKSLVANNPFTFTMNKAFRQVINHCKHIARPQQDGTWITDEMRQAYIELHEAGVAKSVEVWKEDNLVGGLYGVQLGKVFYGESMFHFETNASKLALIYLCQQVPLSVVDCQMETELLKRMGGRFISLAAFLEILTKDSINS